MISFFLLVLTSCHSDQKVFEEYHTFDNMSWNRFNLLNFKMEVIDLEVPYDIYISIRHIPEIPYQEMIINFTIFTPSGDMRTSDYTLDFIDREGKHLSDCMGDYCDLLVPLRKSFRFYELGAAKFEIENKYTKVEMPGIMEVGLILKRSKGEE
jgi:gliding motility-associated lipoprotein GldH